MKCIRIHEGGIVKRLPDDQARVWVEEKRADYVAKSVWKAEVRDKDGKKPQPPPKPKAKKQEDEQPKQPREKRVRSKDKREANRKGKAA